MTLVEFDVNSIQLLKNEEVKVKCFSLIKKILDWIWIHTLQLQIVSQACTSIYFTFIDPISTSSCHSIIKSQTYYNAAIFRIKVDLDSYCRKSSNYSFMSTCTVDIVLKSFEFIPQRGAKYHSETFFVIISIAIITVMYVFDYKQ